MHSESVCIDVGTMRAPGAGAPLIFSNMCSRIARLNFIHTDHIALILIDP